jgi:GAF domain-containing protein
LSLKGAKSPTRGSKLRSTGTKARPHVSNGPNSLIELKKQLDARTRELAEALEQQTATSEVLRVISSSPRELEPVFKTILENAVRVCSAKFGNLWLRDGDNFRISSTHGALPAYRDFLRREPVVRADPQMTMGQVLQSKQVVQVPDLAAISSHGSEMRLATIKLAGARSLIGVPLLKDDTVIGVLGIYRQEVRPFTQKQIELVTNFASQAVIAMTAQDFSACATLVPTLVASYPGAIRDSPEIWLGISLNIVSAREPFFYLHTRPARAQPSPGRREAGALARAQEQK